MLFNSLRYVIFLPIVVTLYFSLPRRWRNLMLLIASYYFYMCWKPEYIVLIVASTVVDYVAGLKMGATDDRRLRRRYLIMSLVMNLGLLFTFKYFNFFNASLRSILDHFHIPYGFEGLHVLLPVGISFYTFQTLSYTIEVFRGHQKPERNFLTFALYVSFFPQLVAGPIERSVNLLPQFYREHRFQIDRAVSGLRLIMWGMFKKVVIADRVAVVVNTVYNDPYSYHGVAYLFATVLFAFQIYCDFSGYSDIAIGSARILGFDLMLNFDRPYYAKSIAEFWKRWHISLSTWFRDYLYISLGGNRVVRWRWYMNLFLTFVISGLWHGANWTFVIWGALNGFYLIAEIVFARPQKWLLNRLGIEHHQWRYKIPAVVWTFSLTCLAWIFFRANTVHDAFHIVAHLGDGVPSFFKSLLHGDLAVVSGVLKPLGLSRMDLFVVLAMIAVMEAVHFLQRDHRLGARLNGWPRPVRWAAYYAVLAFTLFFGAFNHSQQFIYFQF